MSFEHLERAELISLLHELLERSDRQRREQQGSIDEQAQLVHELRVYQVELEMQNRELREAQAELEKSRDRYAELYDFAPIAYFTLDDSYVIRALNLKGAALFRNPREGLISRSFVRLACARNPEPLVALLQRARESALGVMGELMLSIGGDWLNVQAMVSASMDPLTQRVEFRCAMIDVTDRVRAEAERDRAYASERALHQRFESLDRINLSISNILATHERTSVEAILGAIADHALALLGADVASVVVVGEVPLVVTRAVSPDELAIPLLELRVPLRFGARSLGQLTVAYRGAHESSVSDARRTLELLAERAALALEIARLNRVEAEERARLALLEQAGRELASCTDIASTEAALARTLETLVPDFASACMLFVSDGDGQRLVAAQHVDPRAGRLLCRLARPISERLTAAVVAARAVSASLPLSELAADPRLRAQLNLECLTLVPLMARHSRLGILALGYAPEASGEVRRVRETMEQLADRCAAALDSARLLEQLRTAVDSRDTLLAIVSHDLRSPLNAILLTASSLAAREPGQERRRSGAQVQLIQRSVARMGRLVEDLLTATQIDSGQFTVEPSPQSAVEIVAEACMLNEPQVQAKGLSIEQRCAPNLPEVWADRMRIMQVLTNLLGNAIKFTPDGGVLRVTAERCADGVRFAVSDSGPGIAPQQINQVFERYWTGKSTRHGLGLGLFIAQRIVTAHGGRIWVESSPGKGATFHFTLLLPPAVALAPALPRDTPQVVSSPTARSPSRSRTHSN